MGPLEQMRQQLLGSVWPEFLNRHAITRGNGRTAGTAAGA
jgi:hypothetical protein